jgi:sialate O-acetylesterase
MAQNQPAALYNGMVAALHSLPVKGVVWYQGESNSGKPQAYAALLKSMVNDWRLNWQNPSLPFLVVQLPGFMDYNYLPAESNWAQLRAAQATVLQMPGTGLVVALDLGEWNDIHPDNKKDVGERAAIAALGVAYKESIVYAGPIIEAAIRSGDSVILSFKHTGTGLITADGLTPQEFAVAGADKVFRWAHAKIEGDRVVVWHPTEKMPLQVRYGWADNPVNPNLRNREGLPAAPFSVEVQ